MSIYRNKLNNYGKMESKLYVRTMNEGKIDQRNLYASKISKELNNIKNKYQSNIHKTKTSRPINPFESFKDAQQNEIIISNKLKLSITYKEDLKLLTITLEMQRTCRHRNRTNNKRHHSSHPNKYN